MHEHGLAAQANSLKNTCNRNECSPSTSNKQAQRAWVSALGDCCYCLVLSLPLPTLFPSLRSFSHDATPKSVCANTRDPTRYLPGDELPENMQMTFDPSAYLTLQEWTTEWPCLSCDVLPDALGANRQTVGDVMRYGVVC